MFEWNIEEESPRSQSPSHSAHRNPGASAGATAAAILTESEIVRTNEELFLQARRPSFMGKLLRTSAILLVCSFIAALLPQIQVAFGLLGSTVSTSIAHAFPGFLCLKMSATSSSNSDGTWCGNSTCTQSRGHRSHVCPRSGTRCPALSLFAS
jgi:hypothetical protein